MPDQNDEVSRLLYKFEVDEASVTESTEQAKQAQAKVNQAVEDMRRLEKENFEASLEVKRERQLKHFDDLEQSIQRHWSRRLEMVERGSDEEVRIMERRNADLERLERMRQEAEQSAAAPGVGGGIGGGGGGGRGGAGIAGQLLGGIGWGSMMGILSVAGIAGIMAQSVQMLREARTEARRVGEQAGRDPEFQYGLSESFQYLQRTFNISPQQAGRVAGEFVPIAPGGHEGGRAVGALTEQAVLMGRGLGMDPQTISRMMTQFRLLEGTALPELQNRIANLSNEARKAGIPAEEYISTLSQMVQQNRQYGTSIEESRQLMHLFSRELQQGTISVQEIIQAQHAAQRAPLGLQAMVGMQMLRQGGPVADMLRDLGAEDPYTAGMAIRTTLQGGMMTPEGEFIGPSEQTGEQREMVATRRSQIERAMYDMVMQFGREAGGDNPLRQRALGIQMAQGMMGLTGNITTIDDLIQAMTGERRGTRGQLPTGIIGDETAAEIQRRATESIRDSIPIMDRFKMTMGGLADSLNLQLQLAAAIAAGDTEQADRLRMQLTALSGARTPGTQTGREVAGPLMGVGTLMGGPTAWVGALGAGMAQDVRVYLRIDDRTEGKNHEFKAFEENPRGTADNMKQGD
jgi:hypothetical protein